MNIFKLRKKIIKKLEENKKNGNLVIVPYSGGKDSHLAVIKLIERGYYPILVYISLGKKNPEKFNSPDISSLIIGSFIPHIKLIILHKDLVITYRTKLKIRDSVFKSLLNEVNKDLKEIKGLSFYISDNELIKKDKIRLKILKSHLKKRKIKLIKLSNLLKDSKIKTILREMKKYKLKAVIINCDKEFSHLHLIGRNLTIKLLNSIVFKKVSQDKEPITNKIQTFVYFSPLFSKKAIKKLSLTNLRLNLLHN